jgi:hypothetical protein
MSTTPLRRIVMLAASAAVTAMLAGTGLLAAADPVSPLTIIMHAENDSKLAGTATIAPTADDPSSVTISILYANTMFIPEMQYPAEIRTGMCGAVKGRHAYALTSVQEGRSVTVLHGVTIAKLLARPYTIDVHSATAIARYLSCGTIGIATPAPAGAR